MKTIILILFVTWSSSVRAQIPVTDVANLVNARVAHYENMVKWVASIAQLKTQIEQLNQQINLQTDLREWTGDPKKAGRNLLLNTLGAKDLLREYGRTKNEILSSVKNLESLKNIGRGNFRAITSADLDGNELKRDELMFRRYAVLDATQANTEQVTEEAKAREGELQDEIAQTLDDLKSATTDAEVQRNAVKLTALNGQLMQTEATRRREVDAVSLQKIANDARLEQERLATEELAGKDDYLANQRISTYMKSLKLRQNENP